MHTDITSLALVTLEEGNTRQVELLEKVNKQYGLLPNMYRAMANSPALLDTYMQGTQLFRKESGFTSVEAEIIFLLISAENDCAYCVSAHSLLANKIAKVPTEIIEALRKNQNIPHEKYNILVKFTQSMLATKARPSQEEVQVFLAAGYTEIHILNIILAISLKTMSNYTNAIFNTEFDSIFRHTKWEGYPEK